MTNAKDIHHQAALQIANQLVEPLLLPVTVLPEVTYLIGSRMGHHVMRAFLGQIVLQKDVELVVDIDFERVVEILEQYADSYLDFVDATIVSIAELRQVTKILTLDRRDFSIIRPRHTAHFELLP